MLENKESPRTGFIGMDVAVCWNSAVLTMPEGKLYGILSL
jgi:hypothetical protein